MDYNIRSAVKIFVVKDGGTCSIGSPWVQSIGLQTVHLLVHQNLILNLDKQISWSRGCNAAIMVFTVIFGIYPEILIAFSFFDDYVTTGEKQKRMSTPDKIVVFRESLGFTGGFKFPMWTFATELAFFSIEICLLKRQLRWVGHTIRLPSNRLPRRILYCEFQEVRRNNRST